MCKTLSAVRNLNTKKRCAPRAGAGRNAYYKYNTISSLRYSSQHRYRHRDKRDSRCACEAACNSNSSTCIHSGGDHGRDDHRRGDRNRVFPESRSCTRANGNNIHA